MDLAARRVFVGEEEIHLTRTEYNLLAVLVKQAGKVVTHRQLLKEVWGPGSMGKSHVPAAASTDTAAMAATAEAPLTRPPTG